MCVPVSSIWSYIPNSSITDKCAPLSPKFHWLTAENRLLLSCMAEAGDIFLRLEYKTNEDFVFDRFYKYRP
jgi:hypothetical protein